MKVYLITNHHDRVVAVCDTHELAKKIAKEQKECTPWGEFFIEMEEVISAPSSSSSQQQSCQTEQSSYPQCSSGIPGDMWD